MNALKRLSSRTLTNFQELSEVSLGLTSNAYAMNGDTTGARLLFYSNKVKTGT